jgi:Zn-dependent protease
MGSLHDLPEDDWGEPRIFFSGKEILHLAASVAVLTLAFGFVLGIRTGEAFTPSFDFSDAARLLLFSAIVVVPAFILHEIAHKIVAQRKDMWAEFRANFLGLAGGLVVTALSGLLFAVPGAVQIYGKGRFQALMELREARASGDPQAVANAQVELKEAARNEGVISVVGPILNLVLGYGALLLMPILPPIRVSTTFGNLLEIIVLLNCVLAAFNMLPIGPLDGRKVWHWSKIAFFGMWAMILALALLFLNSAYPF